MKRICQYKVWKDDNHAIEFNNQMIDQKINYIHENPAIALLVPEPEDYLFSSALDFTEIKGYVNIEKI